MSAIKSVGVIGIGMMGHGLAKNIQLKGFELKVLDSNPNAYADLVEKGAVAAANPAELAETCDAVVICVGTRETVEALTFGENGLLAGLTPGTAIIDASTTDPVTTARVSAAVLEKGGIFADAPMTRTPKEAEEGRLNTMVGADDATLAAIRPVLEAYAENIFHVGGIGAGHTLKLINNFILLGTASVLGEAVATAKKSGVDPAKILEVCSKGAANSNILQMTMPYALEGDDSAMQFSLANAKKDLRYYESLAASVDASATVTGAVVQHFMNAINQGMGDEFVPVIFDAIAGLSGIEKK